MDEAMHDLTMVTVGMYGDILQNSQRPTDQASSFRGSMASRASRAINKIEFVEERTGQYLEPLAGAE